MIWIKRIEWGRPVVQFTLGHFSEMNLIMTEVEKCYKLLSTFSYKKVI